MIRVPDRSPSGGARTRRELWGCLLGAALLASAGCERKEKILDVKTPDGGVTIEKDSSGNLDIEVEDSDRD